MVTSSTFVHTDYFLADVWQMIVIGGRFMSLLGIYLFWIVCMRVNLLLPSVLCPLLKSILRAKCYLFTYTEGELLSGKRNSEAGPAHLQPEKTDNEAKDTCRIHFRHRWALGEGKGHEEKAEVLSAVPKIKPRQFSLRQGSSGLVNLAQCFSHLFIIGFKNRCLN